jgi:hypothetical protein
MANDVQKNVAQLYALQAEAANARREAMTAEHVAKSETDPNGPIHETARELRARADALTASASSLQAKVAPIPADPVPEKPKSKVSAWLWWTGGATVLGGGAFAAWKFWLKKKMR